MFDPFFNCNFRPADFSATGLSAVVANAAGTEQLRCELLRIVACLNVHVLSSHFFAVTHLFCLESSRLYCLVQR